MIRENSGANLLRRPRWSGADYVYQPAPRGVSLPGSLIKTCHESAMDDNGFKGIWG